MFQRKLTNSTQLPLKIDPRPIDYTLLHLPKNGEVEPKIGELYVDLREDGLHYAVLEDDVNNKGKIVDKIEMEDLKKIISSKSISSLTPFEPNKLQKYIPSILNKIAYQYSILLPHDALTKKILKYLLEYECDGDLLHDKIVYKLYRDKCSQNFTGCRQKNNSIALPEVDEKINLIKINLSRMIVQFKHKKKNDNKYIKHYSIQSRQTIGSGGTSDIKLAEGTLLYNVSNGDICYKIKSDLKKRVHKVISSKNGLEKNQIIHIAKNESILTSRMFFMHMKKMPAFNQKGDLAILIMHRLHGKSLVDYMDEFLSGSVVMNQHVIKTLKLCNAIILAVDDVHQAQLIHRDVKPENFIIMYNENQQDFIARVIDYGFAKDSSWDNHDVLGTPGYVAPEVFKENSIIAHPADIYGLGFVLIETLLGKQLETHQKNNIYYQLNKTDLNILLEKLKKRFAHTLLVGCLKDLFFLFKDMLAEDPNLRPNLHHVKKIFDNILLKVESLHKERQIKNQELTDRLCEIKETQEIALPGLHLDVNFNNKNKLN